MWNCKSFYQVVCFIQLSEVGVVLTWWSLSRERAVFFLRVGTEIEYISYRKFVLQNNSTSDVTHCFLKWEINGRRQRVWCALETCSGKVAMQVLVTAQESLFVGSLLRSFKPRFRIRISSGNCRWIVIFNGTNTNVCCSYTRYSYLSQFAGVYWANSGEKLTAEYVMRMA